MQSSVIPGSLVERVAIIGLGVIGGSLGMALTQGQLAGEVVGFDQDEETLRLALATQTVHRAEKDIRKAVSEADIVILATPVSTYPVIVETIKKELRPGTIITDVGSTKQWVQEQMGRILPANIHFVGGHPMAGSEKAGIRGADRYLLENAVYILTPDSKTNPQSLEVVQRMITAIGARVMKLPALEHDHLVAAVSHLPHMMAVALVETLSQVAQEQPEAPMLAAGGFRDTTRIAAGDPQMWRDIACTNREPILKMIKLFQQSLDKLEEEIRACGPDHGQESEKLKATLEHARQTRLSIPGKAKGVLPGIHEVIVTVPDRPGIIGYMAQVLGNQGINIADIEILRVREGHGGTIRIGFSKSEEADRAVEVLAEANIIVKRR